MRDESIIPILSKGTNTEQGAQSTQHQHEYFKIENRLFQAVSPSPKSPQKRDKGKKSQETHKHIDVKTNMFTEKFHKSTKLEMITYTQRI